MLVLVSRLFPRLADRIARRKVRALFRDEIAGRQARRAEKQAVPAVDLLKSAPPPQKPEPADKEHKVVT